ncbi:discoidin domain-containing protein [Methylobacterium sp. J-030]|uniref:discoidin domain-containing protein n=1 Tax=Methylobacterium sp. J-030 TaxID=2836627 RepID=UPI001FB916E8|nr:discoidin domain-containing protein [Methylobacterium sp. J-030]MCJ2071055.1 discoidin domain-containing protein [Methylobacterium sp. J-030]
MTAAADRAGDLVDLAITREVTRTSVVRALASAAEDGQARGGEGQASALQVDLGMRFPIHAVSVRWNDPDWPGEGAAVRLAFSSDGLTWIEPDVIASTGADGEIRAVIAAGETSWTRHVRVSATPSTADATMKFAQLHVWCEAATLDLIVFRKLLDVDFNILHERPGAVLHTSYSLVSAERPRTKALVGIALLENGAFGNCLVQYYVAISAARALDLKLIKIPKIDRSQAIFLKERLTCHGITFIPADEPLPDDGYFLSGMFFDVPFQQMVNARSPMSMREVVHTYIRQVFNGLPAVFPDKPEDQLIIHIRSGDIFSTWIDPNYPQPPLAFYRMVIERLLAEDRIRSVRMVFENRANPVIPALEAYVEGIGLPLSTQSGTLVDDVAAIANGRYLVFGFGSFGPGVCHLSERVDQVFYFSCNWPQGFQSIETVGHVVEVRDVGGGYMKIGEWTNSEAQRRLMVEYPAENLAFDDRI